MADTFAIHAVLRSLPPSFEKVVDEYVIKADSILFTDFLAEIKGVKVELIEGEIDDTQGIFDIRVIIVISCTLLYYKYLMLMSCLLKQHQSIRGSKRSTSRCCRMMARKVLMAKMFFAHSYRDLISSFEQDFCNRFRG